MATSAYEQLQSILQTMNIPQDRKNDIEWLGKNLATDNMSHREFPRALVLIRALLDTPKEQRASNSK